MREIRTEVQVADTGFRGSPTILIDGVDVDPVDEPEQAHPLTCRVYHRRDGGISPMPDPEDLRAALRAAAEQPEMTSA